MAKDEDDVRRRQVNTEGAEPRRAIPAALFAIGLLIAIFIVFAVIQWVRYHS